MVMRPIDISDLPDATQVQDPGPELVPPEVMDTIPDAQQPELTLGQQLERRAVEAARLPKGNVGKIVRLSEQRQIGPSLIASDPEMTSLAEGLPDIDLEDFAQRNPRVSAWMVQAQNYAKGKEDWDKLSYAEQAWLTFKNKGLKKAGRIPLDLIYAAADIFEGIVESDTRVVAQRMNPIKDPSILALSPEEFEKRYQASLVENPPVGLAIARTFKNWVEWETSGELLAPDPEFQGGQFTDFAQDVVGGFFQIFTAALATAVGGPKAGATVIGAEIFSNQFRDLREKGVPRVRALGLSAANTYAQSKLEMMGITRLTRAFRPTSALAQRGRDIGGAMLTEFLTETVQQIPESWTNRLAQDAGLQSILEGIRETPQDLRQGAYEGLVAMTLAGLMGAPGLAVRQRQPGMPQIEALRALTEPERQAAAAFSLYTATGRAQAARDYEAAQETLRVQGETAQALEGMDPQAVQSLQGHLREGVEVPPEMWVSAPALDEALAQAAANPEVRDTDVREVLDALGVSDEEYNEAVRAGTPMMLPTDAAAGLIRNPAFQAVKKQFSFNIADVEDFDLTSLENVLFQTPQRPATAHAARFSRALQETGGLEPEVADATAAIAEARARRWAADTGRDPAEWFERRGLHVERPGEAGGERLEQDAPEGPRGYTRFEDNKAIMGFFQGRVDRSTGLHELAHVFRRDLADTAATTEAPAGVTRDWDLAQQWVGAEPGQAWTTAQEEKWAKAFEAYVMRGKAPSPELRPLFARFAQWLSQIYRSIRGLNVNLSPEITEVFDRLLATEDEIHAAKLDAGITPPLFDPTGPAPPNVSPELWTAYQQSIRESDAAARAAIEQMELDERTELEKEWRQEGRELAHQHPDQQLIQALSDQGGLELEDVAAVVDDATLRTLHNRRPGLIRRGGTSAELAAAGQGLTLDQLVDRLLAAPTQKELTEQYVQQRTAEWRAGWSPADEVITDEAVAQMMMEETLLQEITGRRGIPEITDPNLRANIREAVSKTRIGDLLRDRAKQESAQRKAEANIRRELRGETREVAAEARAKERARGEQRAERQAERADERLQAERDRADMREYRATAKAETRLERTRERYETRIANMQVDARREAIRRREAAAYRREVAKVRGELRSASRYFRRVVKDKTIAPDYQVQIRDMLSGFDPATRSGRTMVRREGTREFIERQKAAGEAVMVPDRVLDMAYRTTFNQMTIEEVRELRAAVENMAHLGQTKQDLLNKKRARTIAQAVDELTAGALANRKARRPKSFEQITGPKGPLQWASERASAFNAMFLKIETVCWALDGFQADGPWHRLIFDPFVDSRNEELRLGGEIQKSFEAAMEKIPLGEHRQWGKRYTIQDSDIRLTREQMIMVALNSGNAGNWRALRNGYAKHGWTDQTIQNILDALTSTEVQFVRDVWDLVNSMYDRLDQTHMELFGTHLKRVEGHRVTFGQVGEVDGAYFPIVADNRLNPRVDKREAESLSQLAGMLTNVYHGGHLESGFIHERVGSDEPPRLELSVVNRHIKDTVLWATHAVALRDASVLLRRPEIKDVVEQTMSPAIYKQFAPWLSGIARPDFWMEDGELNRFLGGLRRNSTVVLLGYNIYTTIKQPLALTQTAKDIGVMPIIRAAADFMSHPVKMTQFIFDNSVAQVNRRTSWDREGQRVLSKTKAYRSTLRDQIAAASLWMVSSMDFVVSNVGWLASYQFALKEYDFDHDRAARFADQEIRMTHADTAPMNLSQVQRGPEYKKLSVMFYTFFNTMYNQLYAESSRLAQSGKSARDFMRFARAMWWVVIIPAVLEKIITDLEPPEKKNWFYAKPVLNYAAASIPWVRDVANSALMGYPVRPTPAYEGLNKLAALLHTPGKENIEWDKLAKDTLLTAGYLYGLPSKAAINLVQGAADISRGKTKDPTRLIRAKRRDEKR